MKRPSSTAAETSGSRSRWLRKRWLVVLAPVLVFAGLVALAPSTPERRDDSPSDSVTNDLPRRAGRDQQKPFRYIPDDEVYALEMDPRKVRFDLLEGWDREQDAFEDMAALAYVSGPMYERHVDNGGQEITVPLGDLKFGRRVWKGRNRTASRQRAYVGIRHDGGVDFGYGELTDERSRTYDTFIGGLHSLYNDLEAPPESYKGAYSKSMGQRIRYYLPRIRMVMGLRDDGRLEVLMSRDGLTLEQSKDLARRRNYLAAYMPDHASKSRFIIPGVKGFTEEDANWISGGATSFVHVPYMLRMSSRMSPLRGDLVAGLTPKLGPDQDCEGPIKCFQVFGNHLADRALAGLNRVMEQGVEPLARMIWAPTPAPTSIPTEPDRTLQDQERSPLREPPITADPLVLRERPEEIDRGGRSDLDERLGAPEDSLAPSPLPPDLPPPELIQEDADTPTAPEATLPALPDPSAESPVDVESNGSGADDGELVGAPPPPELPPLPPVNQWPSQALPSLDQNSNSSTSMD